MGHKVKETLEDLKRELSDAMYRYSYGADVCVQNKANYDIMNIQNKIKKLKESDE